jgi:hypothetical protein
MREMLRVVWDARVYWHNTWRTLIQNDSRQWNVPIPLIHCITSYCLPYVYTSSNQNLASISYLSNACYMFVDRTLLDLGPAQFCQKLKLVGLPLKKVQPLPTAHWNVKESSAELTWNKRKSTLRPRRICFFVSCQQFMNTAYDTSVDRKRTHKCFHFNAKIINIKRT